MRRLSPFLSRRSKTLCFDFCQPKFFPMPLSSAPFLFPGSNAACRSNFPEQGRFLGNLNGTVDPRCKIGGSIVRWENFYHRNDLGSIDWIVLGSHFGNLDCFESKAHCNFVSKGFGACFRRARTVPALRQTIENFYFVRCIALDFGKSYFGLCLMAADRTLPLVVEKGFRFVQNSPHFSQFPNCSFRLNPQAFRSFVSIHNYFPRIR
mmetsp:Transcript_6787/g.9481  ORF Transcript_6787/g.9481 Transcript_6787/m.9481 type:complete len:207 (+) Transcript_6787:413-1033(+)